MFVFSYAVPPPTLIWSPEEARTVLMIAGVLVSLTLSVLASRARLKRVTQVPRRIDIAPVRTELPRAAA